MVLYYPGDELMTALQDSRPEDFQFHILIAEDSKMHQVLAQRLLAKLGCSVIVTCNGREAVEAYGRQRFDLVLMDIDMPEMDGLEATAKIRAIENETGHRTPVVALTSTGSPKQCRAAGMDGHIAKPLSVHVLDEQLARLKIHVTPENALDRRPYSEPSLAGDGEYKRPSSAPLA
jgi:CheY-like chemotaxis protein